MSRSAAVLEAPPIAVTRAAAPWIYILFFVSGCPALIYQIVWQRALFAIYGTNIESVTIVVAAFMLGLGLGSLVGGMLSKIERLNTLLMFGCVELCIGAYGLISLRVFHFVGSHTTDVSLFAVSVLAFLLVLLPTVLMGGTLPFLVAYLVRMSRNVGASVGMLYFVNTLGSAFACLICARFSMRLLGESGSVRMAAALNGTVGILALVAALGIPRDGLERKSTPALAMEPSPTGWLLPFPLAMALVGFSGFVALSYEILWYRAYSFATGTLAPAFALLLGAYLEGIAFGSLFSKALCARRATERKSYLRSVALLLAGASVLGFAVVPAMARMMQYVTYGATLPLVAVAAALLGALFPLTTHVSVAPDGRAGARMSYLYLCNIIGSTAGTALVGFVLMDFLSMRQISLLLLTAGLLLGAIVYCSTISGPRRVLVLAVTLAAAAGFAFLSGPLFDTVYERMLYKDLYRPGAKFAHLLESRSGVVAVLPDGRVFGGGVYDGRFNTSLVHDTNMLIRAYAIGAMHPSPRDVLMVGLSSGSWAQVIANEPAVEHLTIVEINPAYLQLIPQYPEVASVLHNPKVTIEIDDGRRWLVRHRDRKFDFVVMNTTFHWRANATNLLSTEFLQLVRQHLRPLGVFFYNTTSSGEVLITGTTEFRYGLRLLSFLGVSDQPLVIDKEAWRKILVAYRIDGIPAFDLSRPLDRQRLEEVLATADAANGPTSPAESPLEYAPSIRQRCRQKRIITDDNMGTEWN